MKVAIVFDPDTSLGTDPLDEHNVTRRQGEFLDSEKNDVLVVWREWGEEFEGGYRTHFIPSGIWENVGAERFEAAFTELEALPE